MFTGIVAELGRVVAVEPGRLSIAADLLQGILVGASVAVNGVCLTATEPSGGRITADVMAETFDRSTLGELRPGDLVNLELPVTPESLLGGHIVQGHVDGTGRVRDRRPGEAWDLVEIEVAAQLTRYVVERGSIAVDGVSLTVVAVGDDWLSVSLIPETLRRTTLGTRAVGDRVNLEVDVVAKYVERLLAGRSAAVTAPQVGGTLR